MKNSESAKSHNMMKRVASMFMTLLFALTFVYDNQYKVFADSSLSNTDTSMDTGWDISGSNSFGNLVAEGLMAKNTEQVENNGYNVFSVDIENTLATVSFETIRDCSLVIGIYDNEGESMLAIGTADVTAGETEAYVEIDTDSMPDYFYIRAYLVDSDTLRPLCTEYSSPMYTRSMQEFLSKTVNDFDPNRVMNLDDNEDTNFAVFSEDTKLIPTVENVNEVISANTETQEYVFVNVDESITSLEVGDIFAYEYDGEVLIVKVGSISVDQNQTTIIGQDTELDEVFEHLRIDGAATTKDAVVNTDGMDESVEYLGEYEEDESEVNTYAFDINASKKCFKQFGINESKKSETDTDKSGYSISATIDFSLNSGVKVYVSLSEVYFQVKLDYYAKVSAKFEGYKEKIIPLGNGWDISPCPGVYIGLTPSFVVKIKGNCELGGELSGTIGFKASTKTGKENLTTKPVFTPTTKGEISVYLGFSLEPRLVILHDNVADAKLKAEAGVEISAKLVTSSTDLDNGIRHDCANCIDGDITAKFTINASVKLFNKGNLTFNVDVLDKKFPIADFYFSLTYDTWGMRECPHKSYAFNVEVLTTKSSPIVNAKVFIKETGETVSTDKNGIAALMLPLGKYEITVSGGNAYESVTRSLETRTLLRFTKVKLRAVGETPFEKTSLFDKIKDFIGGLIKPGASDPNDVDYIIDTIPVELRELKVKQVNGLVGNYTANYAAITDDGSLYTWGEINEYGQLGNGTTEANSMPSKILDDVIYVNKMTPYFRSAAITKDGSLYTWGKNDGHLGNGTLEDCYTPVKILDDVVSVSLSNEIRWNILDEYNAALTKDGSLYTWGGNRFGQLGNGIVGECYVPTKIMDNVSSFCLGESFGAAITMDNCLYMWGDNNFGQFGNGTRNGSSVPQKVMDKVSSVYIYNYGVAAITTNGDLYTWGNCISDFYGLLGNGTYIGSCTPTKILSNVTYFNFSNNDAVAITKNGDLYVWGQNNMGHLIPGHAEKVNTPTKIMENVSHVEIGPDSFAITSDKKLYIWGNSVQWQLTNGTRENIFYKPLNIMNNVEIASDFVTSAAITTDGSLYMWGSNQHGNLGNGTKIDSYIPIKIMDNVAQIITGGQTLAITNDGYLYTWGDARRNVVPEDVCSPRKIEFPKVSVSNEKNYSVNMMSNTYFNSKEINTKTFTNLIPNEIYNYYSVNSLAASDMLSADNLLYVGQTVSDENGTLTIPDYVPNGEIFVKAMTEFDVYNAEITSAEAENNSVSLTWNPINGASEYEVISYSENGIATYPNTSDTHLTINDLDGGDYGFVVTSIIYGEQSVPAMNDIVLVHIDTTTKVPALTVVDADGKAKLSWEEIDNALAYKVYSYENGEYKLLTFTAENFYTVQDLTVGEKYGFIVSACVKDVWSELSENDVVHITIGSHTHDYSTEWKYDDNNHWHECACGNKTDIAAHTFDSTGQCTVCLANMVKQTVVITFPDSVMVTTSLDVIIHNGDEVTTGDKLYIDVTIPDGKKLTSLTVNGVAIENGSTYIVGTENVVIAVTFDDITAPPVEKIAITIPENVVVTREGIAINTGDEIHSGDVLRIEATVPDGKKLASLTVNGVTIENGSTYTIGDEDVIISVVFEDIETPPSDKYFITIPSGITVTRNSLALNSGDEISEGDALNIKADIPSGYKLTSLTVNGKSIANGDTYTVGKENVIIAVSFEKLTGDNPNKPDTPSKPDEGSNSDANNDQPFIISNSDIIGWNSILSELNKSSDKTVMVDMNGTTVLPANILQVIKDNSIKLMLKMNNEVSWSIEGKDVEKIDRDVDLKVIIGADNIPSETIKKNVGERKYLTLSIKHNGDFGFSAFLVIDVGEQYSNEPATLYWFNDNTFKLEDSCKVQYGKAVLKFTHASDWIIAFGEVENNTDSDNSNSDNSTDDTSRPIDAKPNETKPDESNNSKPTTTDPSDSSDDEKENPHTSGSRVSLATFLALVTSAALCLITRKQKR